MEVFNNFTRDDIAELLHSEFGLTKIDWDKQAKEQDKARL